MTYWKRLRWPLAPSCNDVAVYRKYLLPGTTLLLGCTQSLLHLSDRQLDLVPLYGHCTEIRGSWETNRHFYTNMVLDGGLNLNEQLCRHTLNMASHNCNMFISRCFNHRTSCMKVATYFPSQDTFHIRPSKCIHTPYNYTFYIWCFE